MFQGKRPSYASELILPVLLVSLACVVLMSGTTAMADGEHQNHFRFTLRVSLDDFNATEDGVWHHLRIEDGHLDTDRRHIGQPQLPLLNAFFILPPGKAIERVELTPQLRVRIPGHYLPYPIWSEEDNTDLPDEPPWGHGVYPERAIYSLKCGDSRNYNLLKLSYYPLEYDAGSEELTMLGAQEASIILRERTAIEDQASVRVLRPDAIDGPFGSHRQWIKQIVQNPEDLDRFYPRYEYDDQENDANDTEPPRLLGKQSPYGTFVSELPSLEGHWVSFIVVTNNKDENGNSIGDMVSAFSELSSMLSAYGLTTEIRTIDWIEAQPKYAAYDRPEAIRKFLMDAFEFWGSMFVLLGGDESVVPTRRIGRPDADLDTPFNRPDPPADFWYTRFGYGGWAEQWNTNGDSWTGESMIDVGYDDEQFTDIFIGRLPARNSSEAEVMVTKALRYRLYDEYDDQAAHMGFYTSLLVAAGPLNDPGIDVKSGVVPAEENFADPYEVQGWNVRRLYPEVGSAVCPGGLRCYAELDDYIDLHAPPGVRWTGTDLRDDLDVGYHLVFHNAHSSRNRWGKPRALESRTDHDCPSQYKSSCRDSLKLAFAGIEHLDPNEVLALRHAAGQEARYCIAMSGGSWTNMMDMDAIGESFMRAPGGGAIAYVGNTETFAGLREDILGAAASVMFDGNSSLSISESLAWAIELHSSGNEEFKYSIGLPLLGVPALLAWSGAPRDAILTVNPDPVTTVGLQTISVTAVDSVESTPIADGIVCVRQGETTYATCRTNSNGVAIFRGLLIQDTTDSVIVSLLRPDYIPKRETVAVTASAPYVAYESHEMDDCCVGGDCDGVVEVGETVTAEVTLRNMGSSTTQPGFAVLRATPAFECALKINDEYRPADIILGKGLAHPTDAAETFTVPMSREGIRVEGHPFTMCTNETFKLWRVEGTGIYTIGTVSPSASADSVFTGIIKARANLSNVTVIGERNDRHFWSGDSIWFEFHGDATEDRITFKAEAPNWLDISTPSAAFPSLASGDLVVVEYPIELKAPIPDQENLVFTVSAYQVASPDFFHSDFTFPVAKPDITVVIDSTAFGDFGCQDTSLVWRPLIHNRGSGEADSVCLTLRVLDGDMTVLDSVVTFSEVEPDSFATSTPFILCGDSVADTAGLEACIHTQVFHKEYLFELAEIPDNPCPPPAPENLRFDLMDGTVVLRWDPISNVNAYLIECTQSENGPIYWREFVGTGTTRYEVRDHPLHAPSGPGGHHADYWFRVSGARNGNVDDHNYLIYGERAIVGPVYIWPKERSGWPKLIPETSVCAPTVAWLGPEWDEGYAIFAAGARIYAWREDGNPLDPDEPSGLFYDPIGGEPPSADMRFTTALAFGSMWREPNSEETGLFLAGNLNKKGVKLVEVERNLSDSCCVASLYNEYGFFSPSSPVIADTVAPYDGEGTYASVLWVPGMSDNYINGIVVDDDQTPYGDENWHFAVTYPSGSSYNYDALALGYNTDTDLTEVIASSRGNGVERGYVACYSTDSAFPATAEWEGAFDTRDLQDVEDQWLSIPAVGDVDGDGDNDVVVMTLWRCVTDIWGNCAPLAGKVYIIDENTGDSLSCSNCENVDFHFLRESKQFPPAGAALADLDNDGDMEIVIAGNTSDPDAENEYPVTLRLDVLDYDPVNGKLEGVHATQDIPFTQRNEEQGNVHSNDVRRGGAVYPIGSPVVADVDYDGECKPDIFVSTSVGAIYGFQYNPNTEVLSPKLGWPLLLPDVPREPVLAVLDPDVPTQYSMVVQCQDGWVHVYDLPRPSQTAGSCGVDWPSFGGDPGNTRGKLTYGESGKEIAPQLDIAETRIAGIYPVPGIDGQNVVLELANRTEIRLEVFDVSGRRVATIHDGALDPGRHLIHWDGKSGDRSVASGVYWYRLAWGSGAETKRVTIVR